MQLFSGRSRFNKIFVDLFVIFHLGNRIKILGLQKHQQCERKGQLFCFEQCLGEDGALQEMQLCGSAFSIALAFGEVLICSMFPLRGDLDAEVRFQDVIQVVQNLFYGVIDIFYFFQVYLAGDYLWDLSMASFNLIQMYDQKSP